jgi:hypothetical protein
VGTAYCNNFSPPRVGYFVELGDLGVRFEVELGVRVGELGRRFGNLERFGCATLARSNYYFSIYIASFLSLNL